MSLSTNNKSGLETGTTQEKAFKLKCGEQNLDKKSTDSQDSTSSPTDVSTTSKLNSTPKEEMQAILPPEQKTQKTAGTEKGEEKGRRVDFSRGRIRYEPAKPSTRFFKKVAAALSKVRKILLPGLDLLDDKFGLVSGIVRGTFGFAVGASTYAAGIFLVPTVPVVALFGAGLAGWVLLNAALAGGVAAHRHATRWG